jgi:hypothetical protein
MKIMINRFLLTTAVLTAGIFPAYADSVAFTNGDLILAFQATGGTGSNKNVFFILGSGVSYRNNGNQGLKGNIGATLSATFGNDWYTRTDIYFGVIGNLNSGPPSGIGAIAAVAGDPSRTHYISTAAASPGMGTLYPALAYTSALATSGNAVSSVEGIFSGSSTTGGIDGGFIAETDGSGVLDAGNPLHVTAYNNRWGVWNPVPGAAFSTFTGGIQQSLGKGGSATYVDVQRVLATNTNANPTGVVGGGTYETTIAIGSDGSITATAAATATAYDLWIATFPTITLAADKLITADPDKDGATNLEEFGFGGNPESGSDQGNGQTLTVDADSDSLNDITLTLEVRSGATFSASGNDLVSAAIDGVTYRIEGSTDLATWDSTVSVATPTLGSGSPSAGYVFRTFRLNAGNGLAGKGFLRASVTQ